MGDLKLPLKRVPYSGSTDSWISDADGKDIARCSPPAEGAVVAFKDKTAQLIVDAVNIHGAAQAQDERGERMWEHAQAYPDKYVIFVKGELTDTITDRKEAMERYNQLQKDGVSWRDIMMVPPEPLRGPINTVSGRGSRLRERHLTDDEHNEFQALKGRFKKLQDFSDEQAAELEAARQGEKDATARHKEALAISERYIKRLHTAEAERDRLWQHAHDRVDWFDGDPEVAKLAQKLAGE